MKDAADVLVARLGQTKSLAVEKKISYLWGGWDFFCCFCLGYLQGWLWGCFLM